MYLYTHTHLENNIVIIILRRNMTWTFDVHQSSILKPVFLQRKHSDQEMTRTKGHPGPARNHVKATALVAMYEVFAYWCFQLHPALFLTALHRATNQETPANELDLFHFKVI